MLVLGFCFNPRARTGRDLASASNLLNIMSFQSTRPHGARPAYEVLRGDPSLVSIHAPARGATRRFLRHSWHIEVSIHAPARGATSRNRRHTKCVPFQSTRPHGARRVTASTASGQTCFNPRARTGRDLFISRQVMSL